MVSPSSLSRRRTWILWAVIAFLAVGGALVIDQAMRQSVTILRDGQPIVVRTYARTVAGALRSAGIQLGEGDVVSPSADTPVEAGAQIDVRLAWPIDIEVGSERTSIRSAERIPANILASAGVSIFPGDRVWVDGYRRVDPLLWLAEPAHRVRVEGGHTITISAGRSSTMVRTTAPTIAEALAEGGFTLFEGDRLQPMAGADALDERGVMLEASRGLTITVDGARIETRAAGTTVGEAVAQAGLPLTGLDVAIPSSNSPLPEDGKIEIVRVQDQIVIEQKPLPYQTEYTAAEDVELDREELLQAGTYGVQATTTRVRKENGQAVSQVRQGEWVAQEPQPRLIGYGTKIVLRTLKTEYGDLEYWRAVQVYATSYSPCRLGVSYCDDVTASGVKLRKGIAAVLVRWYLNMAFSEVYVPGYGKAVIADTGGGIPGRNWIDLGFSDEDYESWHNWVTVYFLTPVPQNIMWVLN
jgi:uncharacterized protein YabE (DUF348 family)